MHDPWWENEPDLGVLCWCGSSVVHVDRDRLKKGLTIACKRRECREIGDKNARATEGSIG